MSQSEGPQSLIEQLPWRAVSTLQEWTEQMGVSDRLYIAPPQTNLAAASSAEIDLRDPPQSPTKSAISSLAPWQSSLSTTSVELATSSFLSDETAKSLHSEGPTIPAPPTSVPSLIRSSSSSTTVSDDTNSVEVPIPRQGVQLLVPDGVEVLEEDKPSSPTFQCCFWFLNCYFESSNEEEWNTHCLHHFKGARPPRTNHCPLCEASFFDSDGRDSWNKRMAHMAAHMRNGLTLERSRPEFHLFKYLWQQRVIGDIDYQELMGNYHLEHAPRPFVLTNGPSRIRRQDRLRPVPQTTIRV